MKQYAFLFLVAFCLLSFGCAHTTRDISVFPYSDKQQEVKKALYLAFDCVKSKDIETLKTLHAYGPKFTDFKNGALRGDAKHNEETEALSISALSDFQFELRDLKINIFDNTAIATFHGFFDAESGGRHYRSQEQCTLVFIQLNGAWKITHEHFSPLTQAE